MRVIYNKRVGVAAFGRQAFAALLCLSLFVWSTTPAATHAPTVFETIQDHLAMAADHGHSQGFQEDLYWAMHGHSHDVADHYHSQALLALGNLGAYRNWFGFQPNTKAATLIFGLFHGTGLASKIIEYDISQDGLLWNLLAFNLGVELGQILALFAILVVMGYWRRSARFMGQAVVANVIMVGLGIWLTIIQINGFLAVA